MSARQLGALSLMVLPLRSLFAERDQAGRTRWECRLCPYVFTDADVRANPEAGTYALLQLVKHLRGHLVG